MKYTSSYTDNSGITTSISVSAEASDLSRHLEDGSLDQKVSDLAASFETSLSGMPAVHLQAHRAIARNLLTASCELHERRVAELETELARERSKEGK